MRVRKTAARPLNVKLPSGIKAVLPELAEASYLQTATAWVTRTVAQYVELPQELFRQPEPLSTSRTGLGTGNPPYEILFYECPERLALRLAEVIGKNTHAALAEWVGHAIVHAINRAAIPTASAV